MMEIKPVTPSYFDPDLHPIQHLVPRRFKPDFWKENDKFLLVGYPSTKPKKCEIVTSEMKLTAAMANRVLSEADWYRGNNQGDLVRKVRIGYACQVLFGHLSLRYLVTLCS